MKKFLDKKIFLGLIIGLVLCSFITAFAITTYNSDGVLYKKGNSNVTGTEALNDLYSKYNENSNSPYISETLIIDSTNNSKTWQFDKIPAGEYILIEVPNLYSFNNVSYTNWKIGAFETNKGSVINGTLEYTNIYTFTLEEPATPSVFIYNYYPNNLSLQSYTFYLAKIDRKGSETIDSSTNNKTFKYDKLSKGKYLLVEFGKLYNFKNVSYSIWNIGNFSNSTNGTPTHGKLLISSQGNEGFYIYTFNLKEEQIPEVKVYNYYPNNAANEYKFWISKIG